MSAAHPHRSTVQVEVRYAETDQMGIVHHANYAVWFELARTELCKASGYHYAAIEELGYLLIVTRLECRFAASARYGETVHVHCWIEKTGSRAVRFAYQVERDGEELATGATDHLWLARATGKPCRTPKVLKDAFDALARGSDPGAPPAR